MTDADLRELERRWRSSGSSQDESLYLRYLVRSGELSPERVVLAAYCGNRAAALALGACPETTPHGREAVMAWLDAQGPVDPVLSILGGALGREG